MAARKESECSTWRPRSRLTSELQLHLCGTHFTLDKELLASKSSRVAKLLQKNPQLDISRAIRDIPADPETMEIVRRFCHGFQITLTPENIVRVACIAQYLGMTDSHCDNNLLSMAFVFLERQILPSWSNCIKALKSAEDVLEPAIELGVMEYCVESVFKMVEANPLLLGQPITVPTTSGDDNEENAYRPNARRKLFDLDWKSEDLTELSLRLYLPIMRAMAQRGIPEEYIAANVCEYMKKWVFSSNGDGGNSDREIVEALETLLPDARGIVPCSFLFEMMKSAIALDANAECRMGLELRIGKQLDEASVKDLLIPCQGYARDEKYDTECVRRILKNFYCNYTSPDPRGLHAVAELIDKFLEEIASDMDLKTATFCTIAEMSAAASSGTGRGSDGLYRAIDVYLESHRHLTESQREELCKVLDCSRLSNEGREHAGQNKKLPIRLVVQILFVSQLRLRDAMPQQQQQHQEEAEGMIVVKGGNGSTEEGVMKEEMERIESRVMELERECDVMKKEMENNGGREKKKKKKTSIWKAVKRKLGCGSGSGTTAAGMMEEENHLDGDFQAKKKMKKQIHPR